MVGKQFAFVQALPLSRSKREQELEQAKARSHAAKVVHRRTKDADRGYQQLIAAVARDLEDETRKFLQGQDEGSHGRRESNERLALQPRRTTTHLRLDNRDIQPELSRHPPDGQQVVLQWRSARSAAQLVPSHSSLRQGNSDPFGVYAIPVDSRINAIMKYTRELYLPTMATDATNPDSITRPEDWKECVGLLTDACTAYAHLARVAAFMTQPGHRNHSNELARQALVYNGKGTSLLRERIEKGVVDHNTLYVMSCFLAAEMYFRNFSAARSHARVLGLLFPRNDIPVDYNLLHNVLRLDSSLAAMSLTRSSFDLENWVPEVFARHFQLLLKTLPESISLTAMEANLDESILSDRRLKDCFVRLRQALFVYLLSLSDPRFAGFEYKSFIRHVVFTSMARLVDHYVDAEVVLQNQTTFNCVITGRAQVQAYTSLAAIMWLRRTGAGERYTAEGTVMDTGKFLMGRLKEKLMDSEWMVSEPRSQYSNVRLWAIFVGADQEQADSTNDVFARTAMRENASTDWFNIRLAHQANGMGFILWEQARERLLRFLHTDVLKPHGSTWFSKTMALNL